LIARTIRRRHEAKSVGTSWTPIYVNSFQISDLLWLIVSAAAMLAMFSRIGPSDQTIESIQWTILLGSLMGVAAMLLLWCVSGVTRIWIRYPVTAVCMVACFLLLKSQRSIDLGNQLGAWGWELAMAYACSALAVWYVLMLFRGNLMVIRERALTSRGTKLML